MGFLPYHCSRMNIAKLFFYWFSEEKKKHFYTLYFQPKIKGISLLQNLKFYSKKILFWGGTKILGFPGGSQGKSFYSQKSLSEKLGTLKKKNVLIVFSERSVWKIFFFQFCCSLCLCHNPKFLYSTRFHSKLLKVVLLPIVCTEGRGKKRYLNQYAAVFFCLFFLDVPYVPKFKYRTKTLSPWHYPSKSQRIKSSSTTNTKSSSSSTKTSRQQVIIILCVHIFFFFFSFFGKKLNSRNVYNWRKLELGSSNAF